jgi:hypothetical protein
MSPKVETFQHDSNLSHRRKKGEVTLNRISPSPCGGELLWPAPDFPSAFYSRGLKERRI